MNAILSFRGETSCWARIEVLETEAFAYVVGKLSSKHGGTGRAKGFAPVFAEANGISLATVHNSLRLARAIPEDVRVELRRRTMPPSQGDLFALARLDHDGQRAIAAKLARDPDITLRFVLGRQVRKSSPRILPEGIVEPTAEIPFMQSLMIALGVHPELRLHRQNVGSVVVRDRAGNPLRQFSAGPPNGAADLSGIVAPEGWRIEIETKSAGGKLSKQQLAWQKMIVSHGGIYVLVAFDGALVLEANVVRGVALVNEAISARRAA